MIEYIDDSAVERALLADMIGAPGDLIDRAFTIVQPEEFDGERERATFEAIRRLRERGEPVELLTIVHELRGVAGAAGFVAALTAQAATYGARIAHYARMVHEQAARRRTHAELRLALNQLAGGAPLDTIAEQVHAAAARAAPSLAALPTPSGAPIDEWPDPPAAPAFDGIAGDFVRVVEPHSEADPVALLVQFLVVAGNVIGRHAYFEVENDRHYANEFIVLVGRSGRARKGTSLARVLKPFENIDPSWMESCRHSGLSSGEGLIWAVRDAIEKVVRQKDGSYEEETTDPGVADKRALVVEAEFANVLRVVSRDGNTLSGVIRNAWDRGELSSMTKNSPGRATGAHVSIIGHITRDELLRNLDRTEVANGLANRFLWICVRRSKELPEGGKVAEAEIGRIATLLHKRVEQARGVGRLEFDADARKLWHRAYSLLTKDAPGMLGSMLARAEAHVLRIALVYAVLDGAKCIEAKHLRSAIALWDCCARSTAFTFGDALGDPVADEILTALRRSPAGLDRQSIRDLFHGHRSSSIPPALQLLARHGLASMEKQDTGGRKREVWSATKATEATKASVLPDLSSLWSLPSQSAEPAEPGEVEPEKTMFSDGYEEPEGWDH